MHKDCTGFILHQINQFSLNEFQQDILILLCFVGFMWQIRLCWLFCVWGCTGGGILRCQTECGVTMRLWDECPILGWQSSCKSACCCHTLKLMKLMKHHPRRVIASTHYVTVQWEKSAPRSLINLDRRFYCRLSILVIHFLERPCWCDVRWEGWLKILT